MFFVNSRRFYLKCCEVKQRFLHVWHGMWHGRLHACMRAKAGHVEQLLWQYSAIWQETFQFLSNVTRFLDLIGNYHKIRTSNFCKVVRQHTEVVVRSTIAGTIVGNLLLSLAVKEYWNSVLLAKLSPWIWCTTFLGYSVYLCPDIDECELKRDNCPRSMDCVNTVGSYRCLARCGRGHRRNAITLQCEGFINHSFCRLLQGAA